ncbi:MAG: ADP-ribosylation factor-like protein, partial [Candidatus Hodarchaeota archaeon]
ILTDLDKKYDFQKDILELKPTIRVEYHKMNFLASLVNFWDMGGQEIYREIYQKNQDVYFDGTDLLIYVIDIQDPKRFENSLEYMNSILQFFQDNEMNVPIIVTFHKYDPDLRNDGAILTNIEKLRETISNKYSAFKILFQRSSIYDIISVIQLVSYGLSVFDEKFFELSELLENYLEQFNSQALIVFDRNGIIISEYYSEEIETDTYIRLLESIKEHLFLLKRMQEESYDENHNFFTIEDKLLTYLHRLKIKSEIFFASVVIKENQKEDFLDKFPDFLEDVTKILNELI